VALRVHAEKLFLPLINEMGRRHNGTQAIWHADAIAVMAVCIDVVVDGEIVRAHRWECPLLAGAMSPQL
jgi:hypothetical protein